MIENDSIIDCILLCGGYARRLYPLTKHKPKVLLSIADRPCIEYIIESIVNIENLGKIFVVVNINNFKKIQQCFDKYHMYNIEIIVEPETEIKEQWGPIKAISYFLSKYPVKDYLVIGGDNVFDFDLNEFLAQAKRNNVTTIAVKEYPPNEDLSRFGTVKISHDFVVLDFLEKSDSFYRHVSIACYYIKNNDFNLIDNYNKSESFDDNLGAFFQWLCFNNIRLKAYIFDTFWFDIGTYRDLVKANKHIRNAKEVAK
ncbi:glucose-1-phosphate thymidylyltransferase [Candidatus Magnetomorum sp. HK-1]|nr:glucose-1-phosphate thymidylyltransferase [Candidatus Magnetomorum sp. HK-1]